MHSPKKIPTTTKNESANLDRCNVFLEPIEILSVDNKSRITLTSNIKKIFAVNPNDKIILYRHRYNNNITLQHQKDHTIINRWILIQSNGLDVENDTLSSDTKIITQKMKRDISSSSSSAAIDPVSNIYTTDDNNNNNKDLYETPILLMDNEMDLLDSFESLLRSEGYKNIKSFSDPKELLKSFMDMKKFKLAVLDIRMPDINGIQLYNILKTLNPSIKVLFITGLEAANELTSMMTDIKSQDVMKKPIGAAQFIQTVTDKIKVLQ